MSLKTVGFSSQRNKSITRAMTQIKKAISNRRSAANRTFSDMVRVRKTFTVFLIAHMYMGFCAFLFQIFEYEESSTLIPNYDKLGRELMTSLNISHKQFHTIYYRVLLSARADRDVRLRAAWKDYPKSFWYVTTVFTTVGTGHLVPLTFSGRLFTIFSAIIGIPLYALFLKHIGDVIIAIITLIIQRIEKLITKKNKVQHRNLKVLFAAFLLMVTTVLLGALGARQFGWTYFDGVYFCFISLSTIGFGDLVPETTTTARKNTSIVYMFYNVVGLSVVSCFICSLVNAFDDMNAMWNLFVQSCCGICKSRKTLKEDQSVYPVESTEQPIELGIYNRGSTVELFPDSLGEKTNDRRQSLSNRNKESNRKEDDKNELDVNRNKESGFCQSTLKYTSSSRRDSKQS